MRLSPAIETAAAPSARPPPLTAESLRTYAAEISHALKENMAGFGYEILATPITDIEPNAEVHRRRRRRSSSPSLSRRPQRARGEQSNARPLAARWIRPRGLANAPRPLPPVPSPRMRECA